MPGVESVVRKEIDLWLEAKAGSGVTVGASGNKAGLFGSSGATKGTVMGSRDGNAALQSLLTALANYGLIVDSSS